MSKQALFANISVFPPLPSVKPDRMWQQYTPRLVLGGRAWGIVGCTPIPHSLRIVFGTEMVMML